MHIDPSLKKKTKTGCKTCKKRRVKCDEGRPACRKCVSSSRVCDGYGIWGGGGTPYGPPQSHRTLSVYCTPVSAGSLGDEEQVCFDWLIKRTAKKFAGLFKSDFWETLIFQASAQEPAVRHAVIALASAHRFEQRWDPRSAVSKTVHNERFTLQQYNKAIQHLRAHTSQTGHSLRVALITCMLFVTLEYLRGQYQRGSAHLRYGMRLLANVSASTSHSTMTPKILRREQDFGYNALVDTYARLGIQSAMFGHIPSDMCFITQDPQTTPYIFSSLVEARRSLDNHLNTIHCLKRYFHDTQSPNNQKMIALQTRILEDLELWQKAYTATITRLETHTTPGRDKTGYILLRIYHEMAKIIASTCLVPPEELEISFDSYTENFITIMSNFLTMWKSWTMPNFQNDLSALPPSLRNVLEHSNTDSIELSLDILENSSINDVLQTPDCGGNGFTVETGYIPPLYYTALKCRIPSLRRQAIRVLRAAPHREGVWNGPLLGDVLDEIVGIEEGMYDLGDPAIGFLPRPEDLVLPRVSGEMRISDVRVILPHDVGDVCIGYKKRVGGEWVCRRRIVQSAGFG